MTHTHLQEVQLVFSSSIPADIISLSHPPYVMEDWRKGEAEEVKCLVCYKVSVDTILYTY